MLAMGEAVVVETTRVVAMALRILQTATMLTTSRGCWWVLWCVVEVVVLQEVAVVVVLEGVMVAKHSITATVALYTVEKGIISGSMRTCARGTEQNFSC